MNESVVSVAKWHQRSLAEQFGNIGAELSRVARFQKDGTAERFLASLDRAHELVTLTIADPRWRKRLPELLRFRELMSDWYIGGSHYGVSFESLVAYCMPFALLARKDR